ncbi:MAG: hypothetical protein DMD78_21340 [Candidatus Rokuibacteriota bacterium]|nr:MAG: hypothetical protein DMD78_21340 [Candidatus Rokubacteria bacterium]
MSRWLALGVALLLSACASVAPAPSAVRPDFAGVAGFTFTTDTFAFPNEIRARNPDREDLYANYCFVLARGLRQFFRFARFDPAAPRLAPEAYVERVRAVAAHAPWEPPAPPEARIVIPGYANLRDFSRAQEAAVKEGLGGRFWTLVHWTNWRVTFPVTRGHQATVAREVMDELDAGRMVQLLVTNWPKPELNHTVVAFAYRPGADGVEFLVWDPNDPGEPGVMTFDAGASRFRATHLYDTEPGLIRAFRMYYSWLL